MAEPAFASSSYPGPSGVERLPRCCPEHHDWATLAQHLLDDFPAVGISDIVDALRRAKDAVAQVGLADTEALATGELIARHQLMMLSGQLADVARLDPERHVRVQN